MPAKSLEETKRGHGVCVALPDRVAGRSWRMLELRKPRSTGPTPLHSMPHSPRLGGFYIFISKAWIASISRSWQNQDTCKIPYNTLDSQKVPKSTVKLTLPLQEMYDTNNIKLKGEKR